jgi:LysM repeat protein
VAEAGPATEPYTVRPGDTLSAIARRRGTSVQALVRANAIADPDRIEAGSVLQVPAPSADAPATGAPEPEETSAPQTATPTGPAEPEPVADAEATAEATPADPPAPQAPEAAEPADPTEDAAAEAPDPADLSRARADVVDAELRYWAAEYEESREAAVRAHERLASWDGVEARAVRARAYLIEGMALGALGDEDGAQDRFGEALAEDPWIELPQPPSPKLVQLFEAAREARAADAEQAAP